MFRKSKGVIIEFVNCMLMLAAFLRLFGIPVVAISHHELVKVLVSRIFGILFSQASFKK